MIETLEELAHKEELIIIDGCSIGPIISGKDESITQMFFYEPFEELINDIFEITKMVCVGNCVTIPEVINERKNYFEYINHIKKRFHRQRGKRTFRFERLERILTLMKDFHSKLKECVVEYDSVCPYKFNKILERINIANKIIGFRSEENGTDEKLVALAIYLAKYYKISPTILTGDYGIVKRLFVYENQLENSLVEKRPIKIYSNFVFKKNHCTRRIDLLYDTGHSKEIINSEFEERILRGCPQILRGLSQSTSK